MARQLLASVAVISAMFAGCSSDTAEEPLGPSSTFSPSSTNSQPADAERDALTAYRGMWSAFVEAARTSNPEAPGLRRYTSDNALKLITSALYTNRSQGRVTLGQLKIDPRVTALTPSTSPTEASVLDCVNDEKWLEHKRSGELVNDVPGGKHRTTATVRRTSEGWKVSRFTIESESC